MAEVVHSPFTRTELRDLNRITKTSDTHQEFAAAAVSLYHLFESNPDAMWNDFTTINPSYSDELYIGSKLLQNTVDAYKKTQRAVSFWKSKIGRDRASSIKELRKELNIPKKRKIQRFSYYPDTIGIHLNDKDCDALFAYYHEKDGGVVFNEAGLHGFVRNSVRLKDDENNSLQVIFLNDESDEKDVTITHERAHNAFYQYYIRGNQDIKEDNNRQQKKLIAKQVRDELGAQVNDMRNPGDVYAAISNFMFGLIQGKRELFWSELIAETAEHGNSKIKEDDFFSQVIKSNQYFANFSLDTDHSYAFTFLQEIDAIKDFLQGTRLSARNKLLFSLSLEEKVQTFHKQNEIIAGWVKRLWDKEKDKRNVPVIMMTIPLGRLWSIGNFISEQPDELRESLSVSVESAEIVWPELIRYSSTIFDAISDEVGGNISRRYFTDENELDAAEKNLFIWKMTKRLREFLDRYKLTKLDAKMRDLPYLAASQIYTEMFEDEGNTV